MISINCRVRQNREMVVNYFVELRAYPHESNSVDQLPLIGIDLQSWRIGQIPALDACQVLNLQTGRNMAIAKSAQSEMGNLRYLVTNGKWIRKFYKDSLIEGLWMNK